MRIHYAHQTESRMARENVRDSSASFRRPTNLSLDSGLVAEAKRLGLNVSRACENGLAAEIAAERGRRWRAENEQALRSSNDFVDENGLPLASIRLF
jgi:antitoxin CcdA